jgi:Ras association (RalGDS/AF-6) domain
MVVRIHAGDVELGSTYKTIWKAIAFDKDVTCGEMVSKTLKKFGVHDWESIQDKFYLTVQFDDGNGLFN